MFTGIIEAKGKVSSAKKRGENLRVVISAPRTWKFKIGDSVAVDGICSTVVSSSAGVFDVEYMPETLRVTTANGFKKDHVGNLERSLKLGAALHGHFVQGHVDAAGTVTAVNDNELTIRIPKQIARFVATKGSVAVNGISLTVAQKNNDTFTVALIPFTRIHTNVGLLTKGARVNVETDMLARYLDSLQHK